MLMCHYWSPYLSEREVCFGGSTNWFGTLPAQAWEDFICPNHDPDWNMPFYLIKGVDSRCYQVSHRVSERKLEHMVLCNFLGS
jgi:flavodoxin